ncbi:helix-turn-helix domain-containing protein [Flavobacterium sp. 25HG05S-40]|uniref:helix-turn-helix domain-containing protein n=1 Tax=Flavobacterium sp. 25HG05S-40 TaxID=3458682 RepID=UPI00404437C7
MNTSKSIRSTLKFNQEEMAQLLNVPRYQLSQFELGKATLPGYAMDLLVLFKKYIDSMEAYNIKAISNPSALSSRNQLERWIKSNENGQNVLIPKMERASRRIRIQSYRFEYDEFLASVYKNNKNSKYIPDLQKIITAKTFISIYKKEALCYQAALKILQYERKYLEKELQLVIANTKKMA